MNHAQIWSIVAIMAAALATMISLTFRYVGARFDALEARLNGRFEVLDARFDHLDRDMQRVIERIFRSAE